MHLGILSTMSSANGFLQAFLLEISSTMPFKIIFLQYLLWTPLGKFLEIFSGNPFDDFIEIILGFPFANSSGVSYGIFVGSSFEKFNYFGNYIDKSLENWSLNEFFKEFHRHFLLDFFLESSLEISLSIPATFYRQLNQQFITKFHSKLHQKHSKFSRYLLRSANWLENYHKICIPLIVWWFLRQFRSEFLW